MQSGECIVLLNNNVNMQPVVLYIKEHTNLMCCVL